MKSEIIYKEFQDVIFRVLSGFGFKKSYNNDLELNEYEIVDARSSFTNSHEVLEFKLNYLCTNTFFNDNNKKNKELLRMLQGYFLINSKTAIQRKDNKIKIELDLVGIICLNN